MCVLTDCDLLNLAGAFKSSTSHELVSHMDQLQQFVSVMASALSTAKKLDIQLTFTRGSIDSTSTRVGADHRVKSPPPFVPGRLSESAGMALASILTATCPNACCLGVGIGVNAGTLRVFGANLPNLTCLEIQDGGFPLALFGSVLLQLLPSLTKLRLACVQYIIGHEAHIRKLAELTFLTSLDLGSWLKNGKDWIHLPPQIQEIFCERLPLDLPKALRLNQLESLHLAGNHTARVCMEYLAFLLNAAPSLRLLSHLNQSHNTICIGDCTQATMEAMGYLHQRMVSGFALSGIEVACSYSAHGVRQSVDDVLEHMPHLMTFDSCVLVVGWPKMWGRRSDCLSRLCQVFPRLQTLHLTLGQLDPDRDPAMLFSCLRTLTVCDVLSSASILSVIPIMPQLRVLKHDVSFQQWKESQVSFQAKLQARSPTCALGEVGGASTQLGAWRILEDDARFWVWSRD